MHLIATFLILMYGMFCFEMSCKPDKDGARYKWCSITDKVKPNNSNK